MQALSERENRRLPFKALVRRRDGHSSGEAPLLSAYVPKRLESDTGAWQPRLAGCGWNRGDRTRPSAGFGMPDRLRSLRLYR